jgi:hypothetical protein
MYLGLTGRKENENEESFTMKISYLLPFFTKYYTGVQM